MTMMNRRGRGGSRHRPPEPLQPSRDNVKGEEEEDDDDLPMDEDDQEILVQDLERRIQLQQEQIHSAFRVLCWFAAAAAVLMAAIEAWTTSDRSSNDSSQRLGCWIHAALSCGTHLVVSSSPLVSANGPLGRLASLSFVAAAALGAVVVMLHLCLVLASPRMWEDGRTGWGLGIANLLTAAVAALLRWDRHDSTNALRELDAARYKHKAL